MDDPAHLNAFNHSFSGDPKVNTCDMKHLHPQQFDHFLVLDLEGKVEILEFPVLMIDAKTLEVVDFFHRLRPVSFKLNLSLLFINYLVINCTVKAALQNLL